MAQDSAKTGQNRPGNNKPSDREVLSANFIREVEEELQAEKFARLWKAYGDTIVTAAILVVLGVAGFVGYKEYRAYQRDSASDAYAAAVADLSAENSLNQLEALQSSGVEGYQVMAFLKEAEILLKGGETSRAIEVYQRAQRAGLPHLYKTYFLVLEGYASQDVQDADLDSLRVRVDQAMTATTPWKPALYEIRALLALKAGDQQGAERYYQALNSDLMDAPASLKARAERMLSHLSRRPANQS